MSPTLLQEIADANKALVAHQLVTLTWGNVSGIDHETGTIAIKPSGVAYDKITPENLCLLNLNGKQIGGDMKPSSDTATHLALYQKYPAIGGICHTHSPYATSLSQAGRELPCLGTTHADHFYGTIPLARALTAEEVEAGYELATGCSIIERIEELGIDPLHTPAILLRHHAPFTWGRSATKSVENAIALEMCAKMALLTWQCNPETGSIPAHILEKHHQRKHGPTAYYGQK